MDYNYSYDATTASSSGGVVAALFGGVFLIVWLAFALLMIISMWKIFTKAGKPGWAAIVPIYNIITLLEVVGKPMWWFVIIFFVPFANLVFGILLMLELGKVFGKTAGWSVVFLFLFSFIGLPWLAFGKDQYKAPPAPAATV